MNQITVDELDFDAVKGNLKLFLQGQSQFDSYDFNGSAMSILLDVLSYNTVYNALYTNLAVNESFIDSASKRSSVVSLAKGLGYTAKSRRSARALVSITVTLPVLDASTAITIPKGTVFSGISLNSSYTFATLTDYSAIRQAGVFEFPAVELVEGTLVSTSYVTTPNTQFVIPNAAVDTTTIGVYVKSSSTSADVVRFLESQDAVRSRSIDPAYFLRQRDDLLYELHFSGGAIGREVKAGNAVRIEYCVSAGSAANGAGSFTYQSGWRADVALDIETVRSGYGGFEEEDIESVRANAPRAWTTQNRAVTAQDYENILLAQYPSIESIHAWGGQDAVPKVYGKVFISAKPYNAERFTTSEKQAMLDALVQTRGVVSISPVIVDPQYLNVELTGTVYYNSLTLRWTPGELTTLVKNAIVEYGSTLNKFNSVLRYSKIAALIDAVDSGVVGNSCGIRVRVPIDPQYGLNSKYIAQVNNPVTPGTFYSTRFYAPDITDRSYIKDNSAGVLELYSENIDGVPTFIRTLGTLNYTTGAWSIPALTIQSLHDAELEFVYTPRSNDVVSNLNWIVTLKPSLITVAVISDKVASGETAGGVDYIFSPVR